MKKPFAALFAALLAAALVVGVAAIAVGAARRSSGSVRRETIDRVDFTVENIEQTFSLADGGAFSADILFTAKKTEADFYAMINDIAVTGAGIEKTDILPAADGGAVRSAIGAVLPAENGEPLEVKWIVHVTFAPDGAGEYPATLSVDYTSGVKLAAADRHIYTVPLRFTVTE